MSFNNNNNGTPFQLMLMTNQPILILDFLFQNSKANNI